MARLRKKGVTDKEAIEAAFILKSYACEHMTDENCIFPHLYVETFYHMAVPSFYEVTGEAATLLTGLAAAGAMTLRIKGDGSVVWLSEDGSDIEYALPRSVRSLINLDAGDYDVKELLTGQMRIV